MNAPFGKKTSIYIKVKLVEETGLSDSNAWSRWTGNGNFAMDTVAQANSFDEMTTARSREK